MSIATQNLLRQVGSGYGNTGYDPYNIYAALLGESAGELQTKKYNEAFGLETKKYNEAFGLQKEQFAEQQKQSGISNTRLQQQLDEMIKESTVRNTMNLANSGFGTEPELNKFGSTYGLTYNPATAQVGTGLSGSRGGVGGSGGMDIKSLLSAYNQVAPYAERITGSMIDIYDPVKAKLKTQIGNLLTRMTGR